MPDQGSAIHPSVARGYRRYAWVVAGLMLAVGLLTLLGWLLDLPILARLLPAAPTMKANAGLGFIVAGLALAQRLRGRSGSSLALSLAVAALGLATLLQFLIGHDFGIDHLFADPEALRAGLPPGRMSQLTAVCFVLIGLQGVLAGIERLAWLRDPLALVLLGLAMVGLASLGFLLAGAPAVELPFNPVPVQSAVLFLLGGLAWMAATPERGMTRISVLDSLGGALARRLLLPSMLLPLLIVASGLLMQGWLGVSDATMRILSAVLTGGIAASMVWWVANLLDRIQREHHAAERFRESSERDGLTGLPNRRALDASLARLLAGRRAADAHFCMLMIDLDFFKSYNDSFGHLAGDEALRITARLLREALRPGDVPARYGGEEFAALLPRSRAADARQVAERIIARFRAENWPLRPVTVSVGVAEASAGDDADSLIARADGALYAAKRGGRDRVELAGPAEESKRSA